MIEVPLYGSSRLGVWRPDREVETTGWELFDTDPMTGTGGGIAGGWERGRVQFELSNHLGNVLVTISDARTAVDDGTYEVLTACPTCLPGFPCLPCYDVYVKQNSTPDDVVDYYLPQILTANDYYPFGMGMPGRKYSEGNYRYGFNGKEKDSDINSLTAYDYGFRIYNPAIGRFLSVDPLTKEYPWYTPYQFGGNTPIGAIDADGLEPRITNTSTNYCAELTKPYLSLPYKGPIQPVDVAEYNGVMVYGSSKAIESFDYKGYRFLPNYVTTPQGSEVLSHYTTSVSIKDPANGFQDGERVDWIVPVNQLELFKSRIAVYGTAANFLFGSRKNLSKSTIEFWNGNWGKGYLELSKEQLSDPTTYIAIAHGATSFLTRSRPNSIIHEDLKSYNKLRSEYLDCSDIAADFARSYKNGVILELTPKKGRWMNGMEYGNKTNFTYHQVFVKDGMVYDPMLGDVPLTTTKFINMYKKMNPDGLNVTWTSN